MKTNPRRVRIGAGAGFSGDRIDSAVELLKNGELDYIVFECLAERTIAIGQKARKVNPNLGYDPLLTTRFESILPFAHAQNVKIVTNMGAANPLDATKEVARIAKKLRLNGLSIATVLGDDITSSIKKYSENQVLELDVELSEVNDIISANVYLGSDGIKLALDQGADVVICGRVADPSLYVGIVRHEFPESQDDLDFKGQAILSGHLLECAGQVTGGYYGDGMTKIVPGLDKLGFPFVDFFADGNFEISKTSNSGGFVTIDTCIEQMLYEIHDPAAYYTPDGIADFSRVRFTTVKKDRIRAHGATISGMPETLKVSVAYDDGFSGGGQISYGGAFALERAKLAADILKKRTDHLNLTRTQVDIIGYNSLFGDSITKKITNNQFSNDLRLRFVATSKNKTDIILLGNEVEALYTNGPSGGGGVRKELDEIVSIGSIFIPVEDVKYDVKIEEVVI